MSLVYIQTSNTSKEYIETSYIEKSHETLERVHTNILKQFIITVEMMEMVINLQSISKEKHEEAMETLEIFMSKMPSIFNLKAVDSNGELWLELDRYEIKDTINSRSYFMDEVYQEPMLTLEPYIHFNTQANHKQILEEAVQISIPLKETLTGELNGVLIGTILTQYIRVLFEEEVPTKGKILLVEQKNKEIVVEANASDQNIIDMEQKIIAEVDAKNSKASSTTKLMAMCIVFFIKNLISLVQHFFLSLISQKK